MRREDSTSECNADDVDIDHACKYLRYVNVDDVGPQLRVCRCLRKGEVDSHCESVVDET